MSDNEENNTMDTPEQYKCFTITFQDSNADYEAVFVQEENIAHLILNKNRQLLCSHINIFHDRMRYLDFGGWNTCIICDGPFPQLEAYVSRDQLITIHSCGNCNYARTTSVAVVPDDNQQNNDSKAE